MNQMKTRLQSLGLLDRAFRAMTDEELTAAIDMLDEDHREAVERIAGGTTDAEQVRAAIASGRIDGTMESLAMVITDASLADCITELGDNADNPTSDQLRAVLPGVIERHGLAVTRAMLASTVAGEAQAAPVIRDLLKHDETLKLPPLETRPSGPIARAPQVPDADREALRARRQEQKRRKQDEARQRREQSARDRGRT
ncbi:MAG: hypothetical protein ACK5OX_00975 [Desertimonas sp.]